MTKRKEIDGGPGRGQCYELCQSEIDAQCRPSGPNAVSISCAEYRSHAFGDQTQQGGNNEAAHVGLHTMVVMPLLS